MLVLTPLYYWNLSNYLELMRRYVLIIPICIVTFLAYLILTPIPLCLLDI